VHLLVETLLHRRVGHADRRDQVDDGESVMGC